MVIPNMVMKFQNVDFFFGTIFGHFGCVVCSCLPHGKVIKRKFYLQVNHDQLYFQLPNNGINWPFPLIQYNDNPMYIFYSLAPKWIQQRTIFSSWMGRAWMGRAWMGRDWMGRDDEQTLGFTVLRLYFPTVHPISWFCAYLQSILIYAGLNSIAALCECV